MVVVWVFFEKSYSTTKEPTGPKSLQLSSLFSLGDLQAAVPAALPDAGQVPLPAPVASLVRW